MNRPVRAGKRKRQQKTCHCAAYAFPHQHDVRRCMVDSYREDDLLDLSLDHKLDDPRRGQAQEINAMKRRIF